jgi:8-oxo-dGTP pyrophosphatase MutT (NUDIX family)
VSFSRQESKILEAVPRTRSAAVTIIIRFSKAGKTVDLNMLKSENGLIEDESLIETVLGEDAVAEMLFIKRSMNPNDRWSGHVALPGGRQEENEALVETAKREALEEVGLDLSSSYEYSYLGSLDDRYTLPINARPFLISTHVFLKMCPPQKGIKLDASEVAACRWIPIHTFHLPTLTPVYHPMYLFGGRSSPSRFFIGSLSFPGIILPTSGEEVFPDSDLPPQDRDPYVYHLWGITLDIVEDFSVRLGLCKRGAFSYMPISLNPFVKLYLWHHYSVPHSLKPITLWGSLALFATATTVGIYALWRKWQPFKK